MQRIAVLALLILSGCGSKDTLLKFVSNNVVPINHKEQTLGTGSVIRLKNRAIVVTNAHVCLPFILRNFYPTTEGHVTLGIVKTDFQKDLCALEFSKPSRYQGLNLRYKTLVKFLPLLVEGYPVMGDQTPAEGYLLNRIPVEIPNPFFPIIMDKFDVYRTSIHVYPGNSGSPAVDPEGRLVGIMQSSNSVSFYGNMVPVDLVKEFLKDL